MNEKIRGRFIVLSIIFMLIGSLLVVRLVDLQIVSGEENFEKSQNRLLSDRRIAAPRGNILDRYGVPIATSRQGFVIQIVNNGLKAVKLNKLLLKLANVLEKNGDDYINNLARYINIDNGKIIFGSYVANIGEESSSQEEKDQAKIEKIKKDVGITYKDFLAKTPEDVFKYFKGSKMFNIDPSYSNDEAYKIMCMRFELLIKGFTATNPVTLAIDVSEQSVAVIEEQHDDFQGTTSELMYVRKYNNASIASHVVGYLRTMDADSYKTLKDKGYRLDDQIGRAGVESSAESYLKGKDGLKSIEMDTSGRTTKELYEKPPEPGDNVILTLDSRLQKVTADSLERTVINIRTLGGPKNYGDAIAGSAVAIDVNNGEILAMASYPSYDPAAFLEDADNKEAQKQIAQWMTDNTLKPMRNRAIQDIYAPGSTFKPLTGIAALEEGAISRYEKINDTGKTNIGNKDFFCLEYRDYGYSHGRINLAQALATSCNIFFNEVGNKLGIDKIDKWSKAFGLGEKTGIDIDTGLEAKGIRANKAYKELWSVGINKNVKDERYKESPLWFPANTADAAIGQSFNSFTPLQIADYVSTIANGGLKYKPHVIKKITKYDGTLVNETKPEFEKIPVNSDNIEAVKEGMIAVTNASDGTAVGLFNDLTFNGKKIKVAGKTGTAETGIENSSSNALFVCYAPADDPKIAVAVVIERGAWGSYSAPVARDILQEYFKLMDTNVVDDKVPTDEVVITR